MKEYTSIEVQNAMGVSGFELDEAMKAHSLDSEAEKATQVEDALLDD